jgi:hypothetical protein
MQDATLHSEPSPVPRVPPPRERRPPIVGPLILIGLGLLFLGVNLGYVSPDVWRDLWRYWPVLLIAAGLELLFGRANWTATLIAILLLIGVAVLAVPWFTLAPRPGWADGPWRGTQVTERLVEDLGDARRASVELRHGAGRLELGALSVDSASLLEADFSHAVDRLSHSVERRGDEAIVRLGGQMDRGPIPWREYGPDNWSLRLSPRIPIALDVRTGASDTSLDLRQLQVTRLDVEAGAASLRVTLPRAAGHTEARVKAGAAGVEITIPEGVAARIQARSGLSGLSIDEGRFPRAGSVYQSPDYDTAANRIDLDIDSGVSGVTVR